MKHLVLTSLMTSCVLICTATGMAATFEILESPTSSAWANFSLDYEGDRLACNFEGRIYLWTPTQGYSFLGLGHPLAGGVAISADGSTICTSRVSPVDGYRNPALWTQGNGWLDLGHTSTGCVEDDSWGSGFDVNHNGSIAVGLARCCAGAQAFRWLRESGMETLAAFAGGEISRASAVSADGTTIVGFIELPDQGIRRPVRWLPDGTPDLYAGQEMSGEAHDTNHDGSIIVGTCARHTTDQAHYWTPQDGLVHLGTLSRNPWDRSAATAVTDEGTVYGHSHNSLLGITEAFVWTEEAGMVRLQDALIAAGAEIPVDIWLTGVHTVSGNGRRLVGSWRNLMFEVGYWLATFDERYAAPLISLRVTPDGSIAELSFRITEREQAGDFELIATSGSQEWNVPIRRRGNRLVCRDESVYRRDAKDVAYSLYLHTHGQRHLLGNHVFRVDTATMSNALMAGSFVNPEHYQTTVSFTLAREQHLRLSVKDPSGQAVADLANRVFAAGSHHVCWNGRDNGGHQAVSRSCFIHLDFE